MIFLGYFLSFFRSFVCSLARGRVSSLSCRLPDFPGSVPSFLFDLQTLLLIHRHYKRCKKLVSTEPKTASGSATSASTVSRKPAVGRWHILDPLLLNIHLEESEQSWNCPGGQAASKWLPLGLPLYYSCSALMCSHGLVSDSDRHWWRRCYYCWYWLWRWRRQAWWW